MTGSLAACARYSQPSTGSALLTGQAAAVVRDAVVDPVRDVGRGQAGAVVAPGQGQLRRAGTLHVHAVQLLSPLCGSDDPVRGRTSSPAVHDRRDHSAGRHMTGGTTLLAGTRQAGPLCWPAHDRRDHSAGRYTTGGTTLLAGWVIHGRRDHSAGGPSHKQNCVRRGLYQPPKNVVYHVTHIDWCLWDAFTKMSTK